MSSPESHSSQLKSNSSLEDFQDASEGSLDECFADALKVQLSNTPIGSPGHSPFRSSGKREASQGNTSGTVVTPSASAASSLSKQFSVAGAAHGSDGRANRPERELYALAGVGEVDDNEFSSKSLEERTMEETNKERNLYMNKDKEVVAPAVSSLDLGGRSSIQSTKSEQVVPGKFPRRRESARVDGKVIARKRHTTAGIPAEAPLSTNVPPAIAVERMKSLKGYRGSRASTGLYGIGIGFTPLKVSQKKKFPKIYPNVVCRQELQMHQGAIWNVEFSPDGKYFATGGQDGVVRVWRIKGAPRSSRPHSSTSHPSHPSSNLHTHPTSTTTAPTARPLSLSLSLSTHPTSSSTATTPPGPSALPSTSVGSTGTLITGRKRSSSGFGNRRSHTSATSSGGGSRGGPHSRGSSGIPSLSLLSTHATHHSVNSSASASVSVSDVSPHSSQSQSGADSTTTTPSSTSAPAPSPSLSLSLHPDLQSLTQDASDPGYLYGMRAFRTWSGHTADVLAVAWAGSGRFVLSASMDKTVRLWHIGRQECLAVYPHTDFVTSVCFHPLDDQYFLTGSMDEKIRIWSTVDSRVLWTENCRGMITAASFSADGDLVLVGLFNGYCHIYSRVTDTFASSSHINMELQRNGAQISYELLTKFEVRSTKGKNASGHKITGICVHPNGKQILVTTNDSRLRLYNLHGYSEVCKYRGHQNMQSQIRAKFSEDGQFILCGSEDGNVFIWPTIPPSEKATTIATDSHHRRQPSSNSLSSANTGSALSTPGNYYPVPRSHSRTKSSGSTTSSGTGNNFSPLAKASSAIAHALSHILLSSKVRSEYCEYFDATISPSGGVPVLSPDGEILHNSVYGKRYSYGSDTTASNNSPRGGTGTPNRTGKIIAPHTKSASGGDVGGMRGVSSAQSLESCSGSSVESAASKRTGRKGSGSRKQDVITATHFVPYIAEQYFSAYLRKQSLVQEVQMLLDYIESAGGERERDGEREGESAEVDVAWVRKEEERLLKRLDELDRNVDGERVMSPGAPPGKRSSNSHWDEFGLSPPKYILSVDYHGSLKVFERLPTNTKSSEYVQ